MAYSVEYYAMLLALTRQSRGTQRVLGEALVGCSTGYSLARYRQGSGGALRAPRGVHAGYRRGNLRYLGGVLGGRGVLRGRLEVLRVL